MKLKVIVFGIKEQEKKLIYKMLTTLLEVESQEIEIIDSQSYRINLEPRDIVISYGLRAFKLTKTSIGLEEISILPLPSIDKLKRKAENKETIFKAVEELKKFKSKIENKNLATKTNNQENIIEKIEKIQIITKDGEKIIISNDKKEADILPHELENLIQVLNKIPNKEITIEFIKNNGSNGSDGNA